ncbi:hypothetical protein [Saccharothrix lopnurensis]|uniref:Uncharacterized protein n=1 Tax=Saccharothrix lopnurensis TaxID=1670621 RepID=A0ABW1P3Z9_9PSEU
MHTGPFLHRLAARVVLDVRQAPVDLEERLAVLVDLAAADPRLAVDLLAEVAALVDDTVVARLVTTPPAGSAAELVDREARRRHAAGDHAAWVRTGATRYWCAASRRRQRSGGSAR